MVRNILGVIAGYVVMALFIFLTFSVAYLAMGSTGAFRPNTFDPSMLWIVVSFFLAFVAALIGGYVCALIARTKRAPQILAGIVIVLGILVAVSALRTTDTRPNVRTGDVPNMEAMQKARTPTWVALLNPVIGAVGVMVGAGFRQVQEGVD